MGEQSWISNACLRSFPFRKELGRPRMVVPTGVVVCGRADGPHRPIERFRFESLNRRITDDPPYQWAVARVMGEVISNTGILLKAVNTAKEKE